MSGSEGFLRFAELAREIDRVRVEENARTSGMHEAVAEMSADADQLEARLNGQRGMLRKLATELRMREPKFTPSLPAGDVDPATSLALVDAAIVRGDKASRQAAERGQYAGIMPGVTPAARSAVVYGLAALVIVALQWISLTRSRGPGSTPGEGPSFLTVMILVPAIGFAIAFAVLSLGARTRMTGIAKQRPRTRMGFLLCFGVGPIALLIFFAVHWQQNLAK